ncbi:MAG TPA: ferritin-like domain-containing protein [Polyangiaceae bacterium]|nr:ferritin-like domain-containing protein [Polyangiaceae bacterium]
MKARSFPPYAMLESITVDEAQRKTDRLSRLYDKTRELSWDGHAVFDELVEKHGAPGANVDPELRTSLKKVLTILMWGELAAWNISADLALAIPELDAKLAATAQVFDEARHFSVLQRYVHALGPTEAIGGIPKRLLRKVLGAPTLACKLVGMQLLFETNAIVIFHRLGERELCPVLSALMPYFERDEARHVGLGILYLPRLIAQMTPAEARRTARFHTECILLLMAGGFALRDDFTKLGLDQRLMTQRVTSMQDTILKEMIDHHGKGVTRAVVSTRTGYGPQIVEWIHPPGGLDSVSPLHQRVHRGLVRTLQQVDRAFA